MIPELGTFGIFYFSIFKKPGPSQINLIKNVFCCWKIKKYRKCPAQTISIVQPKLKFHYEIDQINVNITFPKWAFIVLYIDSLLKYTFSAIDLCYCGSWVKDICKDKVSQTVHNTHHNKCENKIYNRPQGNQLCIATEKNIHTYINNERTEWKTLTLTKRINC